MVDSGFNRLTIEETDGEQREDIQAILLPIFDRVPTTYNHEWIDNYIADKQHFLTKEPLHLLAQKNLSLKTSQVMKN